MKKIISAFLLAFAFSVSHAFSGTVYYVRPLGNNTASGLDSLSAFRTVQYGVSRLTAGDSLVVYGGVYNEKVSMNAVSGTYRKRIVVNGVGNVVIKADVPQWSAVFNIIRQSYITVRNITIADSRWYGFMVSPSTGDRPSNIRIINCTTKNTGASGIYTVDSDSVYILGNTVINACSETIEPVGGKGSQECITVSGVNYFWVTDNIVRDGGKSNTGGEGINAKQGAKNGHIARNQVFNIARLGIYVDAYELPTGNIKVYGNTVHHCAYGIAIVSERGGKLSNIDVFNNLTYKNRQDGIVVGFWKENGPKRNIRIVNNTCVNNGTGRNGNGIRVDKTADVDSVFISNNICAGNRESNLTSQNQNLEANIVSYNNMIYKPGFDDVSKDPMLVDTLHDNYRLKETSPAIDQALYVDYLQLKDIIGFNRASASMDLGAFEFFKANPAPGITLVSPANSITINQGISVSLKATATDVHGIAYVDFYHGTTHIAKVYTRNASGYYEYNWNGVLPGIYIWKAVATDKHGKSTESAVRTLIIGLPGSNPAPDEDEVLALENLSGNSISGKIYPNPTSGKVAVMGWKPGETIRILNTAGTLLKESQSEDVNLEDLQDGIYFLTHNGMVHKLVKE